MSSNIQEKLALKYKSKLLFSADNIGTVRTGQESARS